MTLLLAMLLSAAGMMFLALAMRRHWAESFGPHARPALRLRLAGVGSLTGSLIISMELWGSAIGMVAWFGLLSAAGLAVILGLAALRA